ncbi:MAG: hypothetical protein Q8N28_03280 [bacterium]|nr:hypothetical protein [bacterium]
MKKLLIACYWLFVACLVGCATPGAWWEPDTPLVIIHKYDYQAQPQPTPPGAPPLPPGYGPPPIDYQTIYQSAWDNFTLVIFKNDSYRRVRIEIAGQKPIVLAAYGATADLHFGVGEHRVRVIIEKPTASHSIWEIVRFFKIYIRPEGRSQIFHIYDY